jgi:hypothetical protein
MDHAVTQPASLNRLVLAATTHCLTGCAIAEVLELVRARHLQCRP